MKSSSSLKDYLIVVKAQQEELKYLIHRLTQYEDRFGNIDNLDSVEEMPIEQISKGMWTVSS